MNKKKSKKTPAKINTPDTIEKYGWWDKECDENYSKLATKYKLFLTEWLSNGYNGAGAYKKTCNSNADTHVAAVCAHRLFGNPLIKSIVKKINQSTDCELVLCKKAFLDALEATKQGEIDHSSRISAAKNLLTLNGQLVEKTETKHTFPENIEIKFI